MELTKRGVEVGSGVVTMVDEGTVVDGVSVSIVVIGVVVDGWVVWDVAGLVVELTDKVVEVVGESVDVVGDSVAEPVGVVGDSVDVCTVVVGDSVVDEGMAVGLWVELTVVDGLWVVDDKRVGDAVVAEDEVVAGVEAVKVVGL